MISTASFAHQYLERSRQVGSLLCVGLDSNIAKLPKKFLSGPTPQLTFNMWIINQTHESVAAYKINAAFYEARGAQGWKELKQTVSYLKKNYPDIPVLFDAKRADIGSTNDGYVTAIFDELQFDAVTLHPYMGKEALQPFLDRKDKGLIVLCRTSNPGAGEFQDLSMDGKPLWWHVAKQVAEEWNEHKNCSLVVGATYPEEMAQVRALVGDEMLFLVPGVGAQGGVVADLKSGLNSDKNGLIINSSREIIFSQIPGQAARDFRDQIEEMRS